MVYTPLIETKTKPKNIGLLSSSCEPNILFNGEIYNLKPVLSTVSESRFFLHSLPGEMTVSKECKKSVSYVWHKQQRHLANISGIIELSATD